MCVCVHVSYHITYVTRYMQVHLGAAAVFLLVVFLIMPAGYLGPLSARVRGLFVQHTRTGNPLVDSVAEHQVYVCLVCLPYMSALYVCLIYPR